MRAKKMRILGARLVLLTMLISVFMAFGATITAFAEQKTYSEDDYGGVGESEMQSHLPKKGAYGSTAPTDGSDYYTYGGQYYSMGEVQSAVTQSNVSALDGANIKADVGSANDLVKGFEPVIQLVIGIIAWAIVIGLPLITALDVMYITIPFFREKAETAKSNGNSAMTKTGKNGETKLRWISDEAQHAVETLDLDNGRSPLKTYLISRIGAFIMVAIILYLLIGGQITVVTQLAVRLVSGIMSILSKLGS